MYVMVKQILVAKMLTGGCILKQTKINQRHFSWVFGALLA
jgi:hypothetical protein